jgi:hypothetical protein
MTFLRKIIGGWGVLEGGAVCSWQLQADPALDETVEESVLSNRPSSASWPSESKYPQFGPTAGAEVNPWAFTGTATEQSQRTNTGESLGLSPQNKCSF